MQGIRSKSGRWGAPGGWEKATLQKGYRHNIPEVVEYLSQINRIISKTYGQHFINTQNKKFPIQRGRGVAMKYSTEHSRKVGTIIIQKRLFNIIYIMRTSCKP